MRRLIDRQRWLTRRFRAGPLRRANDFHARARRGSAFALIAILFSTAVCVGSSSAAQRHAAAAGATVSTPYPACVGLTNQPPPSDPTSPCVEANVGYFGQWTSPANNQISKDMYPFTGSVDAPLVLAMTPCPGYPEGAGVTTFCTSPFTLTVSPGAGEAITQIAGHPIAAGCTPGQSCSYWTSDADLKPNGTPTYWWCAAQATPGGNCTGTTSEPFRLYSNQCGNPACTVAGDPGTFLVSVTYTLADRTIPACDANYDYPCQPGGGMQPGVGVVFGQIETATAPVPPPSPLTVTLDGETGSSPNTIAVTMTLKNTGSSDISELNFSDPRGLENDGVLISKGSIGPTKSALTLSNGPTPALPITLPAKGPPVVLRYTYTAESDGDAVLLAKVSGTDAGGDSVTAKQALSVFVTDPLPTEGDLQKLVTSVLLDADTISDQGENSLASAEADSLAAALKLGIAWPGQQQSAVALGLPTQLGVLIGTVKSSAFGQWIGNYFGTLSADLKGGASYLGQTGSALASQLLATATDPQARAAVLGRLVDGIEALPSNVQGALASQADNLGYLGEALVAATRPSAGTTVVKDVAEAGTSALNSLQTNVNYAVDGFPAMVAADSAAYAKNPTGFINAESKHYADATYGLIKNEIDTVLGDGIGKGISAAVKAGVGALTTADAAAIDSAVASSVDSTAPAASDSTAALIQKASVATSEFQTLPVGTALTESQLTALGGLLPGDQKGVQEALDYISGKYGVDLELGGRTSEPLSAAIEDGSPKLSFMKPKAVSSMDMLIGGPSEIAAYTAPGEAASGQVFKGGVTTVFEPVPLSAAELDMISATNPDFVAAYTDRFNSQMKLWKSWQDEDSTLRVLVDGSAANKGGVTAISSVSGYTVPPPPIGGQPLVYLEQLDQPAFQAQFGLSSGQAQTLKASLAKSPGAVDVDYIARKNPDGSFSFFDGLNKNRPFVSDFDLQYIQPAGGAPWPAGLMSTILLDFKDQLEKRLGRLPDHGASGTVFDLPAANIEVADGFVMKTTDPAVAPAVAAMLARRYASSSAIFSSNAARLQSLAAITSDPAQVKALLTQAASYRATASALGDVDAAYLLKKYAPGEKIIVIKRGDVRVGYGPGPKT